MNRSVRCAQLWEREEGLPVRRMQHDKRSTIYAYTSELDEWWGTRRTRLEAASTEKVETPSSRRKPALLLAAGTIAATAAYWTWRSAVRVVPSESVIAVPLTSYQGVELSPSLSPDGSHVAFSWDGADRKNRDIYVKVIGAEPPLRLTTHPAPDTDPAFSPDGRFIAFLRSWERPGRGRAEVILTSALGGAERKIADIIVSGAITRPVWSRDSARLIMPDRPDPSRPPALVSISTETGEKRAITRPPASSYDDTSPALSPDGTTLAFVRHESMEITNVLLQRVSGDLAPIGEPRRITQTPAYYWELAWAADGKELLAATREKGLWRIPLSRSGAPRVIAGTDGLVQFSVSGAASRLAFSQLQLDPDMWRMELPPAAEPVRFVHSTRAEYLPSISPNGRQVAFQSNRSGPHEIWLSDIDGSNLMQLTFLKAFSATPRWSPDSSTIAFESTAHGKFAIWLVKATGGTPRRLTPGAAQEVVPNWSRDGKWVYFGSDGRGKTQVWKIPTAGGEPVQVTRNSGYTAVEAFDGKSIYYAGPTVINTSIWKMPTAGGAEEFVVGEVLSAHSFEVVADGIYFSSLPGIDGSGIRFHSFRTARTEWIRRIDATLSIGLSVSPDRRWLLYSTRDYAAGDLLMVDNFR